MTQPFEKTAEREDAPMSGKADYPPCPTHAVCPACREGWGHWTGHGWAPTVEAERTRRWIASLGLPRPAYTATWENA